MEFFLTLVCQHSFSFSNVLRRGKNFEDDHNLKYFVINLLQLSSLGISVEEKHQETGKKIVKGH